LLTEEVEEIITTLVALEAGIMEQVEMVASDRWKEDLIVMDSFPA
jgi:hypothetical protein